MTQSLTLRSLTLLLALAGPAAHALSPALPPQPRLLVSDASQPLTLQRVDVQALLAGSQAQTRIELVVRNPNPRQLEATLEFPLADGQSVTGFALDVRGEMVGAVPVPKDKGRQVFDDISRRRVDPALLERTAGNNFKLRIYPVPPGGERRVQLQIAETLQPGAQGRVQYRLPLDFGQPVAQFDARLDLRGATRPQPAGALAGAETFTRGDEASLRVQRRDWRPREPLALSWAATDGEPVVVQTHEDRAYAYAEIAAADTRAAPRLPREVQIAWDASGSGASRDHAREFALLDALFAAARDVRVRLVVARDVAEPAQAFDVRGGDWAALRRTLEKLAYDGASSPAAWAAGLADARSGGQSLSLLFSDGLANWPGDGATPPAGPVFTINAAQRADLARLRRLAEAGGGRLVDLNALDTTAALAALTRPGLRLVDLSAVGADELVAQSIHPENGRLVIAARLTAPEARVTLTLVDAQGRRSQRQLLLKAPAPAAAAATTDDATLPLAARRWAELRVAELEADRQRHRAQIRRLGEQFRLLSAETSLIVLDELADYVRYEIVPPTAAMRAAYQQQLAQLGTRRQAGLDQQLESLVRRFADREAWWARDFPKTAPAPKPPTPAVAAVAEARVAAPPPTRPVSIVPPAAVAAPPAVDARPAPPPPAPAIAAAFAPPPMLESVAVTSSRASRNDTAPGAGTASIALRAWEPDAPYVRRLREAGDADRYAVYLDERPGYVASTAFFIDAAEIFFARGQRELAVRVLSNLAEMELENRHILRILAYRLLQAELPALAVPLLERVRELAPDEPQSHRDLALALAPTQPQRAVDLLWDVASGRWDGRFADIDLIALAELNALAARTPGLDLARVDPRLRRNLPLDLRAVLSWDADNTDIDLWVTDPDGEKAFYGHRLTRQGGAMTRDFTGGYGPEEFSLRQAKPGRYEVRAQFFGHRQQLVSPYTTLMLWLATGFGTDAQKDQRVVLRLSGRGEQVLVGTFDVAPPADGTSK